MAKKRREREKKNVVTRDRQARDRGEDWSKPGTLVKGNLPW